MEYRANAYPAGNILIKGCIDVFNCCEPPPTIGGTEAVLFAF